MASLADESSSNPLPTPKLHKQVYFDLHPNEIRLVKLLPGKWFDDIHCELSHAPLANSPIYKAMSYAWGSPKVGCPIVVNGFQYSVTVNLDSALRRIRLSDGPITLWVDALCINQSNNNERTHQVNLMREIFINTEEVIVYLGEEPSIGLGGVPENTAPFAQATVFHYDHRDKENLDAFRACCKSNKGHKTSKGKTKVTYAIDVFCFIRFLAGTSGLEHVPPFDHESQPNISVKYQRRLFEALRILMRSRWWNRIWIIQEIVVPKKVTLLYGSMVAPWSIFVQAALCYSQNRYSSVLSSYPHEYTSVLALFSRMVLDIHNMRELWRKGQKTALLQLLRQFSGRGATDDRDKIYALLGLARDRPSIEPDYSLDIPTVFRNTALAMMERTGSLSVLIGDLGRKNRRDLPSWVPDWSAAYDDLDRRRAENTEMYNAAFGILIQLPEKNDYEMVKSIEDLRFEYEPGNEDELLQADYQRSQETYDMLLVVNAQYGDPTDNLDLEGNVKRYYTRHKMIFRYQNPRNVEVPGLFIDQVLVIGEISFSDWQLTTVIQSWGILAAQNRYLQPDSWYNKNNISLGDAFWRTMCADTIQTDSKTEGLQYRRVSGDDKGVIVSWFLQGKNSPFGRKHAAEETQLSRARIILFGDLGIADSDALVAEEQTGGIDAAIKLATNRRRFFITQHGYIGLGPATTRVGDHLYILPGSRTPFILRELDSRRGQPRVEVVGDCYAHGVMDGEAISMLTSPVNDTPPFVGLRKRLKEAHNDLQDELTQWVDCKRQNDKRFSQELEEAANEVEQKKLTLYSSEQRYIVDKELEETQREIKRRQRAVEKTNSLDLEKAEREIIYLGHELSQEREIRFSGVGYKWNESLNLL